jgi:hypothetical protein
MIPTLAMNEQDIIKECIRYQQKMHRTSSRTNRTSAKNAQDITKELRASTTRWIRTLTWRM